MTLAFTTRRSLPGAILWLVAFVCIALRVEGYEALSNDTLRILPRPGNDFDIHDGALLAPILRERVPGTPGSLAVLEHFVQFFKTTLPDWNLEFQNSTSKTPATGDRDVPFVNLIASRDPPWVRGEGEVSRLTVVAHYDSRIKPKGFIGAMDSAAPCAIILHAMRSIDAALTKRWEELDADSAHPKRLEEQQGIQVFLLDGEEAFVKWTATDSVYGARSLAESMDSELFPATATYSTPLSAISLFVLLDLLGRKNPRMPSYFKTTHWAYQNMAKLESRLRGLGELKSAAPVDQSKPRDTESGMWLSESSKQLEQFRPPVVQDDHIPFLRRGVDIFHLIPGPFPDGWHTLNDSAENLDIDTVEDWGTLMTAFVAEWFELEGYFGRTNDTSERQASRRKTEL